jgi:hypothetical protein
MDFSVDTPEAIPLGEPREVHIEQPNLRGRGKDQRQGGARLRAIVIVQGVRATRATW